MANKHRAKIVTRNDFDSYWSLPMWRNPNIKRRIVKCSLCSGNEPLQRERRRNALKRLRNLEYRENLQSLD